MLEFVAVREAAHEEGLLHHSGKVAPGRQNRNGASLVIPVQGWSENQRAFMTMAEIGPMARRNGIRSGLLRMRLVACARGKVFKPN